MPDAPPRQLAVILHADIVDSTRLVQADESMAHQRFLETFTELSTLIEECGGTTREIRGDALVADFNRASDAIAASLKFQQYQAGRGKNPSESMHPQARIGIGMGEVIIANGTITGAGVVMAQRLEQLASPGGVVVQSAVFETVPRHLPYQFVNLGKHDIKGFEDPVEAYTVTATERGQAFSAESNAMPLPSVQDSSSKLTLPEKPSIAVLPFTNMSQDAEQEYLCDGITEDITTALSQFSGLFVIARNSAFAYKGGSTDVRKIADELGVRYILEGSVRRLGDKMRITGQLIDAIPGNHLWARKFDGQLENIFELQDEISEMIVGSIAPLVEQAEMDRSRKLRISDITSYTLALKAKSQMYEAFRSGDENGLFAAVDTAHEALKMDPRNTYALWVQAWSQTEQYVYQWRDDPEKVLEQGLKASKKLIEVDPGDADGHTTLGTGYMFKHEFDLAVNEYNLALELNPNSVTSLFSAAWGKSLCGLTAEAKGHATQGLRLSPRDFSIWLGVAYLALAQASFAEAQFDEAKKWAQLSIQMHASAPIRRALMIACSAFTGELENAAEHAKQLDLFAPKFLGSLLNGNVALYRDTPTNEKLVEGLYLAGAKGSR
ncbi:MAG: adenylate/guanylate cyclase domain-containing protein [Gammaproteobacteria bacterium]